MYMSANNQAQAAKLQQLLQILTNSRLRAQQSTTPGGLIGSNYRQLVKSGTNNRIIRGRPIPPIRGTTMKVIIPRGTVLFRGTSTPATINGNLTKMKFHYFHPFPCLAVVGRSFTYKRFCLFALKYDTVFYMLVNPSTRSKNNIVGTGSNALVNKAKCRSDGVQGYIALDRSNTNQFSTQAHRSLITRYSGNIGANEQKLINEKYVHRNIRGRRGFPECVMWYDDLTHYSTNASNRKKKIMVEPIACFHMPTTSQTVTERDRVLYIRQFIMAANGLEIRIKQNIKTTTGQNIPFSHYIFPSMATENAARNYLRTVRNTFN